MENSITLTLLKLTLNISFSVLCLYIQLNLFQCFNNSCLQARGALSEADRLTGNHCPHLVQAKEARANNIFAEFVVLNLETVLSKVSDGSLEEAIRNESSDNEILVFLLPGDNIAVPIFGMERDQCMCDFVHVRELKCSLDKCVKKVKSKFHTLVEKGQPVCRHSRLGGYKNGT